MSSREIVNEVIADASLLVKRQVMLARLEARQQLARGRTVAELLGSAGAVAYAGVISLLVCAALAIGQALGQLWLGALIVGGGLLAVAAGMAAIGWARRPREPLGRTRHAAEKELEWARHQTTT